MPSRAIWLISLSGLLPFLTCLVLAYGVPAYAESAKTVFLVYSALTLTFLGGARWGAELVRAPERPDLLRLVLSAVPSVLGMFALVPRTAPQVAVGLLLLSSAGQLVWDVQASRAGLLPSWNGRVRTVMTALGTVCTAAMWPLFRG
ncbi:DUF3429 domain-containing protein [Gemmatimonas sp.]|jgi:hypothetical protein|uniref:DUF3429 domain-containing protein n=1 Tax=Gemmatimonas sp. TaxID=1962908 RepID=UPI0022CBE659|nr:DUF3429 domain-containing protein [Gemmatimonas sp.]MCZ8203186.1 DUF3429 domain-containing protein [Gemmatimonas sp.]